MKYPRKWEEIKDDRYTDCSRLKIHGGWLVIWRGKHLGNSGCLFITDPNHEWELEEVKRGLFFRPKPQKR